MSKRLHKLKNLFMGTIYMTGIFLTIGGAVVCVSAIVWIIVFLWNNIHLML